MKIRCLLDVIVINGIEIDFIYGMHCNASFSVVALTHTLKSHTTKNAMRQ